MLQARQNINYIRNSVKATVDAYDGTVTLYQFDETDPILTAWNKAFGGNLIKPRSEIPAELAVHFRYPEDLFKVQRDLLSKFHVSDPRQFNSGQDFWAVPADPAVSIQAPTAPKQPPYYLLTQFPGQQTPAVPADRGADPDRPAEPLGPAHRRARPRRATETRAARAAAGQPNPRPRAGPADRWPTTTEARSQITLLGGQRNQAQVVYGNLLSLPYGGGLLYVQPVYLQERQRAERVPADAAGAGELRHAGRLRRHVAGGDHQAAGEVCPGAATGG